MAITIKTYHNAGSIFSDGLFESRTAQLAELFRRALDPDLFSHSAYVKFFVTFAIKVPYSTFCDKVRQFLIKEMGRVGGNKKKMRKCKE